MTDEIELIGQIPETVMINQEKVSTKGKLVSYRGGGYEGCFWEWNYFYITKEGELDILHSTGRNGVKNVQDAEEVLMDMPDWGATVYDVFDEAGMKEFDDEECAQNIIFCVFYLWALEQEIPAWYSCDLCEERQTEMPECEEPNEFMFNPKCSGGLAYFNSTKVCAQCKSERTCEECGELDTRDADKYPIIYNEDDCVARCSYCDGRED